MKDAVDPYERRNFIVNAAEGSLFVSGGAFIGVQTVLPALVSRLGGGSVEVGAVGVIAWVGLFLPQVFAARYVETLEWKKPWAIRFGLSQRIVVLAIGMTILVLGDASPRAALWLFLVMFFLNQVLLGITTPGWFDLFAKLTPPHKRGRLVGIRTSIAGAGGFCCGLILMWLLGTYEFPTSYALAFFGAFLLQLASVIVQSRLVEAEPGPVRERRPMAEFFRALPAVIHSNREFRNFVITSALLVVATMPLGFFTVHALREFSIDEAFVGTFTLTIVAVQVGSAPVNGFLADRYGNKTVLVIASLSMLCASVSALLAPSAGWFLLTYVFLGIFLSSDLLARYNMSIEYGPPDQRSTYIGLMNTILAPFYFSGILGGGISAMFGYPAVFMIGVLFSLAGLVLLVRLVKEPRMIR